VSRCVLSWLCEARSECSLVTKFIKLTTIFLSVFISNIILFIYFDVIIIIKRHLTIFSFICILTCVYIRNLIWIYICIYSCICIFSVSATLFVSNCVYFLIIVSLSIYFIYKSMKIVPFELILIPEASLWLKWSALSIGYFKNYQHLKPFWQQLVANLAAACLWQQKWEVEGGRGRV